jgi:DNA-binding response OmpR family regulator
MSHATLQSKATRKVLIVEDEGEMCLLLNIILDGKEYELDHVQTLLSAGEYLQKQQPAVAKDVAMENGADVFLEKPFTRDKIYEALNQLLN